MSHRNGERERERERETERQRDREKCGSDSKYSNWFKREIGDLLVVPFSII